jgi:hypothetical protein
MIPLRDNIRSSRRPLVNYLLIAACTGCFFLQLRQATPTRDPLIERYGMIPARVLRPERPIELRAPALDEHGNVEVDLFGRVLVETWPAQAPPFNPWLTLLTCIFLHGGWLHFLGNVWFLHIFGDNVEDRLGHLGYLAFYLATGAAASAAHLASDPSSTVPTIGASGAIAGVMGAYFLLYPHATVLTLVPIFYFYDIITFPAALFLGIWFVMQFFQGTLALTAMEAGGVAWWAHIGGFVAGMLVIAVIGRSRLIRRRGVTVIPGTERLSRHARRPYYRWHR